MSVSPSHVVIDIMDEPTHGGVGTLNMAHDAHVVFKAEADALTVAAHKVVTRFNWFGFMKDANYESAADIFRRAAIKYRAAGEWKLAGNTFILAAKAASYNMTISDIESYYDDAIPLLIDAARCLSHIQAQRAIKIYLKLCDVFEARGKLAESVKLIMTISDIYIGLGDTDNGLKYLQKGYELYSCENMDAKARECLLKMIEIYLKRGQYLLAFDNYETVIKAYLAKFSSHKFVAKPYIFRALVCLFYTDDVQLIYNKYDEYCQMDYTFGGSREGRFIKSLLDVIGAHVPEPDKYSLICNEYNTGSPFEPWMYSCLLHQKEALEAEISPWNNVDLA